MALFSRALAGRTGPGRTWKKNAYGPRVGIFLMGRLVPHPWLRLTRQGFKSRVHGPDLLWYGLPMYDKCWKIMDRTRPIQSRVRVQGLRFTRGPVLEHPCRADINLQSGNFLYLKLETRFCPGLYNKLEEGLFLFYLGLEPSLSLGVLGFYY